MVQALLTIGIAASPSAHTSSPPASNQSFLDTSIRLVYTQDEMRQLRKHYLQEDPDIGKKGDLLISELFQTTQPVLTRAPILRLTESHRDPANRKAWEFIILQPEFTARQRGPVQGMAIQAMATMETKDSSPAYLSAFSFNASPAYGASSGRAGAYLACLYQTENNDEQFKRRLDHLYQEKSKDPSARKRTLMSSIAIASFHNARTSEKVSKMEQGYMNLDPDLLNNDPKLKALISSFAQRARERLAQE